jgi:adenylate cyclase
MADQPGEEKLPKALQRLVWQRMATKLGDRPEALEKLKKLGLFDPAVLEEGFEGDAAAELRAVLEGFAGRVRERPSLLAELGVRALDVLAADLDQPALGAGSGARSVDTTVVFTDLEGFTSFTSAEGDDVASKLLGGHYRIVDAIVRGRGGRVVKRLGDGHLVTFGAPEAAVLAGIELLEAAPSGLALRAGTHAGPVTPMGADVVGSVVNLASRVTDAAGGGESLVTGEVVARVGELPGVRFGPARPARLKGFPEAVELALVDRS